MEASPVLRVLTMLLVATGIMGCAAAYVGARLLAPFPGPWRIVAWAVLLVSTVGWPWLLLLRHQLPGAFSEVCLSAAYVGLGVFSFLLTLTLLRDAAWLGLAVVGKAAALTGHDDPASVLTGVARQQLGRPFCRTPSVAFDLGDRVSLFGALHPLQGNRADF